MATGTVEPRTLPPPPPTPVESVERERLIRRQLARTSWHVRLVDLASSIAVWIIGLLLLFLLAAAADHVIGLGTTGRCVALAILLGFSLWYLVMQVGPLLVRSINPTYAARTIEEATPTLKNSLINFLLLRQERSGLKEIVYQAVERQAAVDIAAVPVEHTVDRTRLIHAGYALCAVMTVFAAYKILSPKDPFQTIARVLAPWAEIARPSRVQISEVTPGSSEVYYGQSVKIEATVNGVRDGDKINVLYSTADGQTIDQPIPMKLSAGNRYECSLPPEEGSSATANGLLQNVTYRVVAGDAETFPYRLNVVAAPTIIVDRIEYQFPSYTRKAAESVRQQGDIKALEGTKVTFHAIANQPIKSAFIELDPATTGAAGETVQLTPDGQNARGTITLKLQPDRQTPWRTAYQVRFINERGERSQKPILHRVEVLRDLSPEVQILKPESPRISLPEDGEAIIEVRAVDPDFGLAKLYLDGTVAAKPPLNINLLEDNAQQPPQATVSYAFHPREHGLKAGDELRFAAVAEDNRTNSQTGQPEPNVTRTKEYTLHVTEARKTDQGKSGQNQQPGGQGQAGKQPDNKSQPQNGQQNAQQNPQKGQPKNEDKQQPDQKNTDQKNSDQKNPDQQKSDQSKTQSGDNKGNQSGDQQSQKGQEQNGDKSDGQQKNQQPNQQQSGDQKSDGNQQPNGDQKKGDQQTGDQKSDQQQGGNQQNSQQQNGQQQNNPQQNGQQSGTQQSDPQNQQGDQNQGGQGSQNGQAGKGSQSNNQSGEQQSGTGQSGEGQSGTGQQRESTGNSGKAGQQAGKSGKAGTQHSGDQKPDGNNEPNGDPSGGEPGGKAQHDGQAIERVLKEMQKRGETPQPGKNASDQSQNSQNGSQPNDSQPNDTQQSGQQSGNQSDSQPGGQSQQKGSSGAKGQDTPNAGTPEGNDQKLGSEGKGEKGQSKSDKTGDRLGDEKHGQNPSEQQSGGNKGGESHGASKTDKGEKSDSASPEKRDPGAGRTGDEGAGQASQDKSGSGDGNFKNRDKNKEQQPDGNKPNENKPGENEPSPANSSHKQSDSKGQTSGENSGGGKQGAGQAGAQKGNDSAGSKSAGDQGNGQAQETGSGETGSKAGQKQPAAGKTGQSGTEKGEGSASRENLNSQTPGEGSSQPKSGQPGNSPTVSKAGQPNGQQSADNQSGEGKTNGDKPVGGAGTSSEPSPPQAPTAEEQAADAANLEYSRKATEMALRRLKDAEHNPDPELLDKLGWTREDLAEFLRRWEALEKSATETPTGKRDLDEALKSLGLRDPNNRRRAGGKASDNQRDLRDAGNRSAAPPKYREMFDAFRKGAARSAP